ncbi:hypothetical protein PBI_SCTP2_167 [Salicola phage SCTP-2]|nr:hypothetical protein PBI_SCTP2_167 [Salicola phage SCTP-2]
MKIQFDIIKYNIIEIIVSNFDDQTFCNYFYHKDVHDMI